MPKYDLIGYEQIILKRVQMTTVLPKVTVGKVRIQQELHYDKCAFNIKITSEKVSPRNIILVQYHFGQMFFPYAFRFSFLLG